MGSVVWARVVPETDELAADEMIGIRLVPTAIDEPCSDRLQEREVR